MTVSVQKIPELKNSFCYSDFFDWLFQKLHLRHKRGFAIYFPAINAPHTNLPKYSKPDPVLDDKSYLCKRTPQKESSVDSPDQIDYLREENKRLLMASQNWHKKYLLLKLEQEVKKEEAKWSKAKDDFNEEQLLTDFHSLYPFLFAFVCAGRWPAGCWIR